MSKKRVLYWFRQDLRLSDNPALSAASQHGEVIPVYILDDIHAGNYKMGAASRWWLHHSLTSLNQALDQNLCCYQGDAELCLLDLIKRHKIDAVYWNRCYEPWRIERDQQIKSLLKEQGIDVHSDNGSLLWEPWQVLKKDGTPYKVFTPFYRRGCLNAMVPRPPLAEVRGMKLMRDKAALSINALNLLPTIDWAQGWQKYWQVGERGAQKRLATFLAEQVDHYQLGRNFPAQQHVSRLSPYLHFGEISPNQIWHAVKEKKPSDSTDTFLSELGWREFSYYLLYHFPMLPEKNLQKKFDAFSWKKSQATLKCWQRGETGYPIVDAGMRELWQTGYMHGRVRMIVGSFLVKNLLLHWHHGEEWFWDCLVDADLANNSASWQWVAGCGADAAPYFRIFNPITQGQKFDPEGEYTRYYVPELKHLPKKYLFNPWQAPSAVLEEAGVVLGKNYPKPIVDLKLSRERALEAFRQLKVT